MQAKTVLFRVDGTQYAKIVIVYSQPRQELIRDRGINPGSLFFDGVQAPRKDMSQISPVSGTAYRYWGKCGSYPYHVNGHVTADGKSIVLSGTIPKVDLQSCKNIGSFDGDITLRFISGNMDAPNDFERIKRVDQNDSHP